jgi:hypothetical protein
LGCTSPTNASGKPTTSRWIEVEGKKFLMDEVPVILFMRNSNTITNATEIPREGITIDDRATNLVIWRDGNGKEVKPPGEQLQINGPGTFDGTPGIIAPATRSYE